MKKRISVILTTMLLMVLSGCQQSAGVNELDNTSTDKTDAESLDILEEVAVIDPESPEFLEMQIPIEAPSDAENVVYHIIGEEVAEITFTLDQCEYVMRASKTLEGEDLHGVSEPVKEEVVGVESDGVNCSSSMTIFTMKQGGQIATVTINIRYRDTIYLTLVTMDKKAESLEPMLSKISSQIVESFETMDADAVWGITLTAEDVSPTGLTIICEQVNGEQHGELQTGSLYWLEVFEDDTWQAVSYLPQEYDVAWTAEAWIVSLDDTTEWNVDWEWLYGELPSGTYRIGKFVMDWIEAGHYEEQMYYAEFEIE